MKHWINNTSKWIRNHDLIVGLVLLSLLTLLCVGVITMFVVFDFGLGGSLNEIGGTVGGLTSPVIGIVTSVFLFYTLLSQQRTLRSQKESGEQQFTFFKEQTQTNNFNLTFEMITKLESQFSLLECEARTAFLKNYKGMETLNNYVEVITKWVRNTTSLENFLDNLEYCMDNFFMITHRVLNVDYKIEDRDFLMRRLIGFHTRHFTTFEVEQADVVNMIDQYQSVRDFKDEILSIYEYFSHASNNLDLMEKEIEKHTPDIP